MSHTPPDPFAFADCQWNIPKLCHDLANIKGQHLTPMEKLHLRGLLSGHSPSEIAHTLGKSLTGLQTDLSATLYRYIKTLTHTNKIYNWRSITELLTQAGYKHETNHTAIPNDLLPLPLSGKVANIYIQKDRIILEINLTNSELSDPPKDCPRNHPQTSPAITLGIQEIIRNMNDSGMPLD